MRLKDGFSTPGLRGELAGGSFGRQQGSAEVAGQSGAFGVYGAVSMLHDDGWRDYSPSRLRQGYADVAWKDGPAEVHLSLLAADNDLTGSAPQMATPPRWSLAMDGRPCSAWRTRMSR